MKVLRHFAILNYETLSLFYGGKRTQWNLQGIQLLANSSWGDGAMAFLLLLKLAVQGLGDINYIAESVFLGERKQLDSESLASSYPGSRLHNEPITIIVSMVSYNAICT